MFNKLSAGFPLLIFFLVLGAVTWLLGHILKPFFFAIFWAVLLAAIFDPVNEWLRRKFKNPNASAGLALAAVLLTLILPAGLILTLLVGQSLDLYQSMNQNGGSWMQTLTGFLQSVGSHPLVARFQPDHAMITEKSVELLKTFAEFLVKNLSAFTQNTMIFLIEFAVALYCLFYFFRDGEDLFKTISRYLPVDDSHIRTFTSEFLVTAKATLKFTFVIGGIQGLLGGLVFYFTGIENPLVWGVLMVGLSIVPAIGNAIIWAPAGILMLAAGMSGRELPSCFSAS
ncbi:MAG TPA: AI-2E family transporter, partial [Smithellaceae bacterium]|nr:AI-2E family transporter [Smithellaceae bacterium]